MPIVANKANGLYAVDKSYCTHNRSGAGSPNGTAVPQYVGEIYWDTTNKVRWKAVALTNADWTPLGPEVT